MRATPLLVFATTALFAASGCIAIPAQSSHRHSMDGMEMDDADMAPGAHSSAMAGDDPHAQLGMDRPAFPPGTGTTPSQDAASHLEQMSQIAITNDTKFNPSHGVRSGSGTLADPYVISGYDVTGDLALFDTSACVEIKENWIDGQLRLNWNGQCIHVHHNFIRDLRVNENIARTGLDTGGLIEQNTINYVGQIRHYDGEFRDNTVGPRDDKSLPAGVFNDPENQLPFTQDTRVLNIDGWNEALFDHNTIVGSVDLKLHGHHHSTGFLATHSHYHGDGKPPMAHVEDHTKRWSSVSFTDNSISDPTGYGLRYTDENHAGDDRTAASETTKSLNDDHVHHTHAEILRNTVKGAGIWVDVFNADDTLHTQRDPGWLEVSGNTVELQDRDPGLFGLVPVGGQAATYVARVGIQVSVAKQVELVLSDNTLSYAPRPATLTSQVADLKDQLMAGSSVTPTAILLERIKDANITVSGNRASGFVDGLVGASLDAKVNWTAYGNDFAGTRHSVYYDDSVANHPQDKPLPAGPRWQDDLPVMDMH